MITVNGEPMEWEVGLTVKDIITRKKYTFPLLAVWINDSPVPRDDFNSTKVPDGAKVQIIHMISGG
ncbi:sulfur carrier protein ThiS [Thermovirga sp.]|uniref:sulfur carrier protein ThiS n=1 Tax=Thermovirga sp. TaxID=2699834 RepID=UPI0025E34C87|nr:sulfur carrier protein ThiS [Thermovirga sp.]MBO8153338.1 sulfur carrier protein ThiS [Thermovirga sp.]